MFSCVKCIRHRFLLWVTYLAGEDFTFRCVSGPWRTNQRADDLPAGYVFETLFGPQGCYLPSPLYKHQKHYMID